ncbi:Holliday junction branch migration protein RuvA [Malaciobacter canalis]|jgi:Holliday junction DNA helicase RuvA|uniref:Holliday junction branch migration complex subunit RuvA n=2 Tax=Malaciobacter TaxID=2321114 RepID=A0AB37A0K6_9BACT|nr:MULTISPECIES: Holliday junction branch migration protein RuvA [Malaciobacter]PHO10350.1 Holliday junction branch migration protein RuvA [Malaciobacter canalis]PHO12882.1 Holliday junction branch migration protein RuvA [Malaciobacter marinus]PPK62020.1 Holliday junction DNA helicase subunit RuvA [Malaciobacter marinus]QEE32454.1 RuvABC resolvasome, subunit RuvA [Malaciobacter canalis]RYA23873.1 Holliday junction branch migration protein RuvA [Malaciobacter halophilus]
MIVGIEGKIEKKEPTFLHINANGLIYEVFVSINCSSKITKNEVKLYTTHIIREDAQNLYGFLDLNEKKLFDTVIKINGVGPKVALAICSTFTPSSFSQIVSSNDISMLKRVPGIGPKGASRILVELSGFVIDGGSDDESSNATNALDAALALESLGFKKDVVSKVLKTCVSTNTGELVKEALKKLQK